MTCKCIANLLTVKEFWTDEICGQLTCTGVVVDLIR